MAIAVVSRTAKARPATAAARRLRQRGAISIGPVVVVKVGFPSRCGR